MKNKVKLMLIIILASIFNNFSIAQGSYNSLSAGKPAIEETAVQQSNIESTSYENERVVKANNNIKYNDVLTDKNIYAEEIPLKITVDYRITSEKIINGENLIVKIKADNDYIEEKNVTLALCLYDSEGRMVKYITSTKKVSGGKSEELEDFFEVPGDSIKYHAKAFIWDDLDNMYPWCDPLNIN